MWGILWQCRYGVLHPCVSSRETEWAHLELLKATQSQGVYTYMCVWQDSIHDTLKARTTSSFPTATAPTHEPSQLPPGGMPVEPH